MNTQNPTLRETLAVVQFFYNKCNKSYHLGIKQWKTVQLHKTNFCVCEFALPAIREAVSNVYFFNNKSNISYRFGIKQQKTMQLIKNQVIIMQSDISVLQYNEAKRKYFFVLEHTDSLP